RGFRHVHNLQRTLSNYADAGHGVRANVDANVLLRDERRQGAQRLRVGRGLRRSSRTKLSVARASRQKLRAILSLVAVVLNCRPRHLWNVDRKWGRGTNYFAIKN